MGRMHEGQKEEGERRGERVLLSLYILSMALRHRETEDWSGRLETGVCARKPDEGVLAV